MAPDNQINFRLRGIPHDCQSRSEVRELVGSVLPVESGTNLVVHSLAVNPTERTSRVATLTFNNIPRPLFDKTKDQWAFDLPHSDYLDDHEAYVRRRQLVFDTHFSGFTALQYTEEEDCRVDLVALSGLGGHAFGSFKERNGSFMWLRDALTIDIPIARIMIYGYDTSLVRSISFQNLANLGQALQADLKIIRKSNRGRPIIFIGHSLGGLILKEAIIEMKKGNSDEDCEVLQSTSAFLFFGVPHRGMAIESLAPLVRDQPNRALLESLGKNSEVLHRLQDDFKRAFGDVSPKVVSYFETEKSPTAQKEGDIWKLTGPPEVLVDPASAKCGSKDQYPINRNHSEMVKYTSHYDDIYTRVRAALERLVSNTRIPFDDSTGYGASLFLSDQQQECLKSFSFAEQDQRCKEICVERETCEWLRDNAKYRYWISKPRGLLWIKGNPGVGKSFLMKSAFTTMKRWIAGELVVSFFFHGRGVPLQRTPIGFFRALLSSTLAFFPKFLSHLVVLFQAREKIFGSLRQDRWNWSQEELKDFLTTLLTKETKTRPVVIFVDALDECGKDSAKWLLSYFKDLMTDVTQEGGKLRICFSSRHYPVLGLDVVPAVIVEEQNGKDIRCVIRKQLKEIQPEEERQQLEKEILMKAQGGFQWAVMVASMVTDDYSIAINTETLHDRIRTTPQALEQLYAEILNDIPDAEKHQTKKLFEWVLFAGRPLVAQELREALVTDRNMTCATVSDLRRHRDWNNTVEGFERRVKYLSRGLMEFQTREVWEQYEPHGEDFNREAQFIHQSVPEFLQEGNMSRMGVYSITIPLLAGPCHFQLAISCIKYLMLNELLAETTASRGPFSAKFPLAPYAVYFFFHHIQEAETHGLSHLDLLSLVRWSPQSEVVGKLAKIWRILNPNYTRTPKGWPFLGATALHVLVSLGSMSAFKDYLQGDGIEVDGKDSEGNSPLLLATKEGRHDMALFLVDKFIKRKDQKSLDQGPTSSQSDAQRKTGHIDVNVQNDDGDTPLDISLTDEAHDLTFALIDVGADLKYFGSESALLFHAARTRNMKLLTKAIEKNISLDGAVYMALQELREDETVLHGYLSVLLKAGANAREGPELDGTGEEAIHRAARQGQTNIIKLLLYYGASASTRNVSGQYALEIAVEMGHKEASRVLFRETPGITTNSVLDTSIRKGLYDLALLFIQDGVFVSIQPLLRHLCPPICSQNVINAITQRTISLLADGYALHEEHDVIKQPLISATRYGLGSVAKAIVRRDSTIINDADANGKTALILALQRDCAELALFLITEGHASNIGVDFEGRSPLILAITEGYLPIARAMVLQNPSSVDSTDAEGKTTLLHALENDSEELAIFLVAEVKASNTGVDWEGRSPLILATIKGFNVVAEAIIQRDGVSSHMTDDHDTTALTYAIAMQRYEIQEAFAKWYPELEISDEWYALLRAWMAPWKNSSQKSNENGETALMRAAALGNLSLAQSLLKSENVANVVDQDSNGKTALIHATLGGNSEIVKLLVNHKDADSLMRKVDEDGRDALCYAVRARERRIAHILQTTGCMKVTDSITLSEAVAFNCNSATLRSFITKRTTADFPTRYPISIPHDLPPFHDRRPQLENIRSQVAAHARHIAPILVATVYGRERAVKILLATGQVSELSCLEALRISEKFGFQSVSETLRHHSRTNN